jgi:hypothetical protein
MISGRTGWSTNPAAGLQPPRAPFRPGPDREHQRRFTRGAPRGDGPGNAGPMVRHCCPPASTPASAATAARARSGPTTWHCGIRHRPPAAPARPARLPQARTGPQLGRHRTAGANRQRQALALSPPGGHTGGGIAGSRPCAHRMRSSGLPATSSALTQPPRITAGRRAVIWPIHHVASVPAIMGIHETIASVSWIFMRTVVSPERAHMPHSGSSPSYQTPHAYRDAVDADAGTFATSLRAGCPRQRHPTRRCSHRRRLAPAAALRWRHPAEISSTVTRARGEGVVASEQIAEFAERLQAGEHVG